MNNPGGDVHRLTLDDLAALNREMAALVRAGLPLEKGLSDVAQEFSRGAGRLAQSLARQTSAGTSLPDSLAAIKEELPPLYLAVVTAGLRSGRLSAALEGLAETAARISELRRIAAQAAIYPLLVMAVAWMMAVLVLAVAIPQYGQMELEGTIWAPSLDYRWPGLLAIALGVPAAGLIAAIWWWRRSGRAAAMGRARGLTHRLPGIRKAVRLSRQANFAELLQLMVACRVPLQEALPLAAQAADPRLIEPTERLAAGITAGASLHNQRDDLRRLPPLVRMALGSGHSEAGMIAALRSASYAYQARAAAWIAELAVMLPVALILSVGLAVVAIYAGLLMQPYLTLLYELAGWV